MKGVAERLKRFHQNEDAQALMELALALPILLLVVCGIIDFGWIFADKVAVTNAARNGARYATVHPTAWSNASSAPANTIEGQIQNAGGPATISNDDTHILISYLNTDGTTCGHYSQSSNSFTGGTQSICVQPGQLNQVQVTYQYGVITPIIHVLFPTVTLTSKGVAIYYDRYNTTGITLSGAPSDRLTGTIYAKCSAATFSGGGGISQLNSLVVVGSATVSGSGTINLVYNQNENYSTAQLPVFTE